MGVYKFKRYKISYKKNLIIYTFFLNMINFGLLIGQTGGMVERGLMVIFNV